MQADRRDDGAGGAAGCFAKAGPFAGVGTVLAGALAARDCTPTRRTCAQSGRLAFLQHLWAPALVRHLEVVEVVRVVEGVEVVLVARVVARVAQVLLQCLRREHSNRRRPLQP